MLITVPKCDWCGKDDKMEIKMIWFKHKGKKHYVQVWMCNRCDANNGIFWCG